MNRKLFFVGSLTAIFIFGLFGRISAQNIPIGLRNFIKEYSEYSSLSKYSFDERSITYNDTVKESFESLFYNSSDSSFVFNDIYQVGDFPKYITVKRYCELIDSLYNKGFKTYVYSLKLKRSYREKGNTLYELTLVKNNTIEFRHRRTITAYYQPFVKLKLSIIYDNAKYKILRIEPANSSLLPEYWACELLPQSLKLGAGFGNSSLNMKTNPNTMSGISYSAGNEMDLSLTANWDLAGNNNFKLGLFSGLYYGNVKNIGLKVNRYYEEVSSTDIDSYPYILQIEARDIEQKYDIKILSVPLGVSFNYAFKSSWKEVPESMKSIKNYSDFKNYYPVRPGISIELNAGLKYHLVNSSKVIDNTGTYSYSGRYKIWNPQLSDSSTVTISDLPEYGFFSDTTFSNQSTNTVFKESYLGVFSELYVKISLNQIFEIYAGPSAGFALTDVNEKNAQFILSEKAGEANNLMSARSFGLSNFGFNAGVVLNLKPTRQNFFKYAKLSRAGDDFEKASGFDRFEINISSRADRNVDIKKLPALLHGDWLKKPKKYRMPLNKSRSLKIKYPEKWLLTESGSFTIYKPFGYDVLLEDCPEKNNVNDPLIRFKLSDLINDKTGCVSDDELSIYVKKLPDFNFVYVSLLREQGDDLSSSAAKNRRERIADLLKEQVNEARKSNKEILIYLSAFVHNPIVYCNFDLNLTENMKWEGNQIIISKPMGDKVTVTVFKVDEFGKFKENLINRYVSNIADVEAEKRNLLNVKELLNLNARLNSERRFVSYNYIPFDVSFYKQRKTIKPFILEFISYIESEYGFDAETDESRYMINVYVSRDQYKDQQLIPVLETNHKVKKY
ncbi:MAG: hypothetical protein K9G67_07205 [Bacteroidales bacterium]|nr:hypothetical protein [Bacteroidales bacterium]MCF8345543.1 hypothetical protein [Bacteroidales bacterium]MCF8376127.1 hypothetical protein [Bacteroidales bacterium]